MEFPPAILHPGISHQKPVLHLKTVTVTVLLSGGAAKNRDPMRRETDSMRCVRSCGRRAKPKRWVRRPKAHVNKLNASGVAKLAKDLPVTELSGSKDTSAGTAS
jgi:hypothetical protein